jgi:hypothetical protein
MRDRPAQRDPAEPLPGDRVGSLPAKWLEPEPEPVLQEHETEIGFDWYRWSSQDRVEVSSERLEENRIVKQAIDAFELFRHAQARFWEDRFPQSLLWVYRSQRDGSDPY